MTPDLILKQLELKATINGQEVPLEIGPDFKVVITGTLAVNFSENTKTETETKA